MLISIKFDTFFLFMFLKFLSTTVSGNSPELFSSTDNILLNCGASGNSTSLDGRIWTGDIDSKFISSSAANFANTYCKPLVLAKFNDPVPYQTCRIFHSQLNYSFHVRSGLKIVRLYFNPVSAGGSNGSKAVFSVTISPSTLLSKFSPSNYSADSFFKEFSLNIKDHQILNLVFTPGTTNSSYGFINGIEIVSDKQKRKSKIPAIIGAAAGVIMVLVIVRFTIFWYCRRIRFSQESTKPLQEGICRIFTAEEIRNATNNFDRDLIIGDGGFGRVFKGYIDTENTPVAIKALKPTSSQGSSEFWAEIEMLSKIRHNYLVSLIGYCNEQHFMILVYEYMAKGSLHDHLYHPHNPPLAWKQRLEICVGTAKGIKYLHTGTDPCIIHRDIKSSNILLDENWVPKVSDFGLSRLGPTSLSRSHVTTDVKALCGRPAVDIKLEDEQHSLASWAKKHVKEGTVDQIVDPNLMGEIATECLKVYSRIAVKCLHDQKNERPTMSNVLKKLEVALKLQESADFGADENGIETAELSLRHKGESSGGPVQSCPTFWPKNTSASKESYRFFSDRRARVDSKMAKKPPSLRRLRGLFYTIFAYKSLPSNQGQSRDCSSCGPDLTSEKMLIEIMAAQEL
ncbi:receptor-like protein kinase FERONIA isoform X2 [Mercurialis annua]|uniref:receptor-like protein kinase FERONIA isoform X2 n=1 Tax=Mercurialis annua TaxID=3986 RepID=UPI00215F48BA|nr:receptor-like protein kinase FERONIA isoform X2 [Mercurialis annua]